MKMRRSSDRWKQRRWPRFTHALSPSLALPLSLCPSSLLLVTLACCFLTYRYVRLLSVFLFFIIIFSSRIKHVLDFAGG